MDKTTLVGHVNRLIAEFGKLNKRIVHAGLVKAYPEFENSSFILVFACPWMDNYESCYDKTDEVVKMMYNLFPVEAIKKVHAVNVFDSYEEVEFYIKNECKLEDSSCFLIIQPIQAEMELAHA